MSRQKRQVYEFDNFRLDAGERQLVRDGQPITLPSKAFDLLVALVENKGRLVAKEELYQRVWADQIVEESNLTVQMSAIRKALGERKENPRYIVTVPGHGYRFIGEVASLDEECEVVIETETLSRIVIEREETSDAATRRRGDGETGGVNQWWAADDQSEPSAVEGGLDSGSALQGATLKALPAADAKSFWQHRSVSFLSASLVLALLVAVGAIWLYQSRNQTGRPLASLPPQQMILRRFTTHGAVPVRVAISPDGKTLVYAQRIKGQDSLWLGQIETNTSVLIYQQQGLKFNNLTFTPDGSNVYFNVSGPNRPTMLARMSVLGGTMTELIPGLDGPVTFSPDGRQMAFRQRDGETKETSIIIADAADGQNRRTIITRKPPESISSGAMSWSPDGLTIAFTVYNTNRQEQVMSVSVADGSTNKISSRDWGSVSNLAWLPDGSGLLLLARENIGERMRQIWLVSYPEGEARLMTNDLNVFLQDTLSISADGKLAVLQGYINAEIWIAPQGDANRSRRVFQGVAPRYEGVDGLAWTPDGRLLYTANVGNSRVIWSIKSDGSDLRQLTPSRANASDSASDGNMCVTSDGRYVVFESNRSGSLEIWRVNSDGSNLKQLTAGGNNSLPSVSPDGQWVIYSAGRNEHSTLQRISIDGGEATQISGISSLVSQVSPDGHYIACLVSSPGRLLIIPFTGGEPVKSFPVPETALQGRQRIRWMPDGKSIIYKDTPQGLWRQALDEEEPEMVKGFEELRLRHLAWSFDGRNLAYTSGPTTYDIILIENFK